MAYTTHNFQVGETSSVAMIFLLTATKEAERNIIVR